MIKKWIMLAFLGSTLFFAGCATTGSESPQVEYQEIMIFDNDINKDFLYDRTRLWLAETFVDSKAVIELADKDAGILVGNGGMRFTFPLVAPMPGKFSLRIDIKDGRIRTTYSNFNILGSSTNKWFLLREGTGNGYPDQAISTAKQLNVSLKAYVEGSKVDNDW